MGLLDLLGRKRARDKPQNSYEGQDFSYLFGRTTSGENVDEFKAMQTTAVYACVRILAEAVASLPIHVYELTSNGKEKKSITRYTFSFTMSPILRCRLLSFERRL